MPLKYDLYNFILLTFTCSRLAFSGLKNAGSVIFLPNFDFKVSPVCPFMSRISMRKRKEVMTTFFFAFYFNDDSECNLVHG